MKTKIDFDKVAEAEAFGALAVGRIHRRSESRRDNKSIDPRVRLQQAAGLRLMLSHLWKLAKEAGAEECPVKTGRFAISFDRKDLKIHVLRS